ncbi:Pmp3 family protein [Pseudoalteromonas sp. NCCP-2140]|uniref:YqaE/Pmp3 family membrane protein n=1 Tax=Pseudoalteromonas sp. NCCP-2140 TaxID=2942288 RepID=UPI002041637A|nr:YqaE/Pmp3 family membrane protein [Pseudoalteromonas sp. NCCP-2140]GKW51721.1 Pmp3 family protein [Pseudoalteromonas sp. NCCP-2140]
MDNKLLLIIISLFLPPVVVFLKAGAGKDLVINIILCFIFFIPAVIHSLWLCTR